MNPHRVSSRKGFARLAASAPLAALALAIALSSQSAFGQDAEPRRTIRIICWASGFSEQCKGFQAGLQDPAPAVRGEVVRLMVEKGFIESCANCGATPEILTELLRPGQAHPVRLAAARLLAQMGEDGTCLAAVVRLLQDPSEEIRLQTLRSFPKMADNFEFFAAELATVARHPNPEVRRAVAAAYARIGKRPPATLVADGSASRAPVDPPAPESKSRDKPPLSREATLRLLSEFAQRGAIPPDALAQLDHAMPLLPGPDATSARRLAFLGLANAPVGDRPKIRAHLYLWAGGK